MDPARKALQTRALSLPNNTLGPAAGSSEQGPDRADPVSRNMQLYIKTVRRALTSLHLRADSN